MPDLTQEEAFIAGLLEGEGSFSLANKITPRIRMTMTDLDVMIRAATCLGAPSVLKVSRLTKNWKQPYYLTLHGEQAIHWMDKLFPVMGKRRQEQIDVCLKAWNERKSWTGRKKQRAKPGPKLTSIHRAWMNPHAPLAVGEEKVMRCPTSG